MRRRYATIIGLAVISGLLAAAGPLHAGGGTVEGQISLAQPDGTIAHGDWIRVMLVTEAFDVGPIRQQVDAQIREVGGGRQGVRSNRLHLEFYKEVMARITDNARYVAASTLTTEDGSFKFADVPPSRYWVVITFPSIINGYKVAWQAPAEVVADATVAVMLSGENLLFSLEPSR